MKKLTSTMRLPNTIAMLYFLLLPGLSVSQLDILLHDASPGYGVNYIAEDFAGNVLAAVGSNIGKYDPVLSVWIWTTTIVPAEGASGISNTFDLIVDGSGNTYLTGRYTGSMVYGSTVLTSLGSTWDIFVTKLDPNGNFLWAKSFGTSTGIDVGNAVALDGSGNIYITGSFCNKPCSGGPPTAFHPEIEDIYVAKLNNSGTLLWQKRFAPTKLNCDNGGIGHDMTVDAAGNLYATGWFAGTFKFGNTTALTLTSAGQGDVFTIKINNSGTAIWARAGKGAGSDRGLSLFIDAGGNVNVGGYYGNNGNGAITFAPYILADVDGNATVSASQPVSNAFLVQYSSSGNINWAINPAPVSGIHHEVNSIIADPSGSILISMPQVGLKSFSLAGVETGAMLMQDNFAMPGGYPYPKTEIRDLEASSAGYIFSMNSRCGTVPLANLSLENLGCQDCAYWYDCLSIPDDKLFIRSTAGGGAIASPFISSRSIVETVDFELFPNPATDELQIRIPSNNSGATVHLMDQLGRILLTRDLKSGHTNTSIELDKHFSNGIYFIQVEGQGEMQTKRFVITR